MTSLMFRVVANVVNSAAWAASGLLEVMWPRDDAGKIWLDEPAFSVASGGPAAPCADPHPAGAADPAGVSDAPPSPPAGSLTWFGWCYPAIVEVLADHYIEKPTGYCRCGDVSADSLYNYHDHVAALISERIGCDPARAIAALQNLQTQE